MWHLFEQKKEASGDAPSSLLFLETFFPQIVQTFKVSSSPSSPAYMYYAGRSHQTWLDPPEESCVHGITHASHNSSWRVGGGGLEGHPVEVSSSEFQSRGSRLRSRRSPGLVTDLGLVT